MNMIRKLWGPVFLGLTIAFPLLFPNPAVTTIAIFALIIAGAALGWNIFSGYTGYLSLGSAAFTGLGAYLLALICQLWNIPGGLLPFLLLLPVGLVTGICALPLGWIVLKTRRFTFMVITIALFTLVAQLPRLLDGINPTLSQETLPIPSWDAVTFNAAFYYAVLATLLLALAVSWWIRHSKYGLSLRAIRDDEERAQGLGMRPGPVKLAAFMMSAGFLGMAGALTAYFLGFATPASAFDRTLNIALPLTVFLGGIGTLWGPILGAVLIVPLQQYLTLQFGTQGWDLILYGLLFLVVIRTLPDGIIPSVSRRWVQGTGAHTFATDLTETEPARLASAPVQLPGNLTTPIPTFAPEVVVPQMRPQPETPLPQLPSQPAGPSPIRIPSRHTPLPQPIGMTQRVRAQRLVPQSGPAHQSGKGPAYQPGWPCPRCHEPLWLWEQTFFCIQCGLRFPANRTNARPPAR